MAYRFEKHCLQADKLQKLFISVDLYMRVPTWRRRKCAQVCSCKQRGTYNPPIDLSSFLTVCVRTFGHRSKPEQAKWPTSGNSYTANKSGASPSVSKYQM